MHELSLCAALIDQVTSIAREQKVSTVSDIYVRVGPLSGVEHYDRLVAELSRMGISDTHLVTE